MTKQPAVYILASQRNGTLYTGVTSDLVKRIWSHRNDVGHRNSAARLKIGLIEWSAA